MVRPVSALLVAHLHILSLGKLCLVQKYKTRLKRVARDKLFILFCLVVGDEEKRLRLTPGGQRRQS